MTTRILKHYLIALVAVIGMLAASCKKDQPVVEVPAIVPEITNIQPKNPQPGDVVTITGTNFGTSASDVKLTIGGTVVTVTSVTATQIKFTVPQTLTSGALALSIKGSAVANKDAQGSTITVTPKPVVTPTFTAMSPTSGKAGDVVTLTGTNFNTQASENKVFFATATGGTVVLATVKSATTTTLTVEVPGGAITGAVLITVSGTNAVVAAGFNTTFTVNTGGSTGTSTVSYVQSVSGSLSFNKIGTATNEIATMWFDKAKNMLYYSDYTGLNPTGSSVYKLDPGGNSAPVALTTDARITKVTKITTDAAGNVYVLKYEDLPSTFSLYKITADGATVTEIKSKFSTVTDGSGRYFLFVNANNEICLRPDLRIKQNGDLVTTGTSLLGLQQGTEGAFSNGTSAYVAYTTDNSQYSSNCVFTKWNLTDNTVSNTTFTLKTLFDDDADRTSSSRPVGFLRYAVDDNDNFYAMIDKSTSASATSRTWIIRKAKNGTAGYTTLGSFYIKFPSLDLHDYAGLVMMVSDARGNLFIKANQKDIIRISF